MKIAVVANKDKCSREDFDLVCRNIEATEPANLLVGTNYGSNVPSEPHFLDADPELVVVLGGDGTILDVCRNRVLREAPILGINFGKLGYLANFGMLEFLTELERGRIKENLLRVSERIGLAIHTNIGEFFAANDCVIDIGSPFRSIQVHVAIDGFQLPVIRGDGIIVSTSSGSTAYNMSAYGPLLHPEVPAIILNPKNPHRLTFRPLVIPSSSTVSIESAGGYVIVDGRETKACGKVLIQASETFKIVTFRNYWDTLTAKLHWGS